MNRIAEHIVERLKDYNPYYMYAEQEALPYCVYEVENESAVITKHGIVGWRADVAVYLAVSTEPGAKQLKEEVVEKLQERIQGYTIVIASMQPSFADEQWLWKIDFSVTQHFN